MSNLYSSALKFIRSLFLVYVLLGAYAWFFADNMIFLPPSSSYAKNDGIIYIKHNDGQLATIQHHNKSARYTILYSHGNAVDIGHLRHLFADFYQHGYSVLAYDYSGYGLSSGQPSEQQAYDDIERVYTYLTEQQGVAPENIIVYGHSLGAAIALDLASKKKVAGLVLEAPFVSAFRVLTRVTLYPFDKFSNIDKLPDLNTPVYFMHSRDDRVVPFWHSQELLSHTHQPTSHYWLDHAGHDGISFSGEEYWSRLEVFLATLSVQ